jgi:hypothetical protein
MFEEYADMTTREICNMVYERINEKIAEIKNNNSYNNLERAV